MNEDRDDIDTAEDEASEGHPWRTTILPPMPSWMAEGRDPPEEAIVRKRRPVRTVVFAFESIATARTQEPPAAGETSEVRNVAEPSPASRRDRVA